MVFMKRMLQNIFQDQVLYLSSSFEQKIFIHKYIFEEDIHSI